jgi:hypothetical protein
MRALGKLSQLGMALCCCVVLVSCAKRYDSPYDAGDTLIRAFLAADIEKAKSATVPEQWDRIEELMKGREPFKCSDEWGISGSSRQTIKDEENEWHYSATYQCVSQLTPYCLRIKDMLIRETEDGWKVYDWSSMCETSDYASGCVELCDP